MAKVQYAAVAKVHGVVDPVRRTALLNLLRIEAAYRSHRCFVTLQKICHGEGEAHAGQVCPQDESRNILHPVGKFRLLREYYKVYCAKRPVSKDKPAVFPSSTCTYVNEVYEAHAYVLGRT